MTAGKHPKGKPYVFLHERADRWQNWFDLLVFLIVVGFALFCAAYSSLGFWAGLWDIIKHS